MEKSIIKTVGRPVLCLVGLLLLISMLLPVPAPTVQGEPAGIPDKVSESYTNLEEYPNHNPDQFIADRVTGNAALASVSAVASPSDVEAVPPDITVDGNGSGNFKTIQAAINSIPRNNRERIVIFIKDGIYKEKLRIDAACITLRGQSRKGTRIEFPQLAGDFGKKRDDIGVAVINVYGDDFVLENLTVANTAGIVGPHSFTIQGRSDRTVIIDCDVLSEGADTVALWKGESGRYYHARSNFRGAVDFMCPRGWCYIRDSTFFETKNEAAVWHDGRYDKDMKFVLRNCKFDGVEGWHLARHHHDAQFYLLDCTFSRTMIDRAPFRVRYPLDGGPPSASDKQRNAELDKTNIWGERAYFFNCHREGGDYSWHQDNLASAPNSPKPEQITAACTFAGKWDPERQSGPTVQKVIPKDDRIEVIFDESVTVKGRPRLVLKSGGYADYTSGSGSNTLIFNVPAGRQSEVIKFDFNGSAIIASEAAATLRRVNSVAPLIK